MTTQKLTFPDPELKLIVIVHDNEKLFYKKIFQKLSNKLWNCVVLENFLYWNNSTQYTMRLPAFDEIK